MAPPDDPQVSLFDALRPEGPAEVGPRAVEGSGSPGPGSRPGRVEPDDQVVARPRSFAAVRRPADEEADPGGDELDEANAALAAARDDDRARAEARDLARAALRARDAARGVPPITSATRSGRVADAPRPVRSGASALRSGAPEPVASTGTTSTASRLEAPAGSLAARGLHRPVRSAGSRPEQVGLFGGGALAPSGRAAGSQSPGGGEPADPRAGGWATPSLFPGSRTSGERSEPYTGDGPLEGHLERLFGFSSFRAGQREAIDAVLAGHDCLAVMPTGSGKSITYLLPAFLLPGVTIVVSPLISLMQDQLSKLEARGLAASSISSQVPYEEQRRRLDLLRQGKLKLLLVAPERFKNERFLAALAGAHVALLAVDEAHCVSQWGHDFRPDYLKLAAVARALGRPPVLAVTATATRQVRDDIARQLELGPSLVTLVRGFDRPNLHLDVVEVAGGKGEKLRTLLEVLDAPAAPGPGIVYCATRKNTEKLAHELTRAGRRRVGVYHAGLSATARDKVQRGFFAGDVELVVATNAFGLGIDKQDVRFVHHHDVPGSLEAYYQEAGRAGRDGGPARCSLLFAWQDVHLQRFFIETAHPARALIEQVAWAAKKVGPDPDAIRAKIAERPSERAIESALRLLEHAGGEASRIDFAQVKARAAHEEAMLERLLGYVRTPGCRRRAILRHFGADEPVGSCGACDRCAPGASPRARRGAEQVADPGRRPKPSRAEAAAKRAAQEEQALSDEDPEARKVLGRLKALRATLARQKKVPPYRIFHDRTLQALAVARPTTRAGLLEVHGLGERKVAQFGDDLLMVLATLAK